MSDYLINKDELLHFAIGSWHAILRALAPSISDAVDGSMKSTHYECPFPENHNTDSKQFRLW